MRQPCSGYFSSATATFGTNTLHTAGANDAFVTKISPSGSFLWARSGGRPGDEANNIAFDAAGHLFISGYCSSNCVFGNLAANNTVTNGIFLARLDFPLPLLGIQLTNSQLILLWETNSAYAVVAQATTNLGGGWNDVTNLPVLVNGTEMITNLALSNTVFYRLRKAN